MKTTKFDSSDEKRILTGMIMDKVVCGRISHLWKKEGLFKTRWANMIGGWCVTFYGNYEDAPKGSIEGLFDNWAGGKRADEKTVDVIDAFLASLSDEYDSAEDVNSDYITDCAGKYFNRVRLETLADQIKADIEMGNAEEAEASVGAWGRVDVGVGTGIDVMTDNDAIRDAFEQHSDPLIIYPGQLGKFFGDQLGREEFVAFMGASGRGKTFWLMDVAVRGVQQKRKVAFFATGDMSQNQMMRRFMARFAEAPIRPGEILIPNKMFKEDPDAEFAEVYHTTEQFLEPLDFKQAQKACYRKIGRRTESYLKLSTHSNSSINVAGIRSVLQNWERAGWIPDVVVVDYADILAPPHGVVDSREQINATWKQLRRMSQDLHCLVVTATQADANSYKAGTITRSNFSEDRRKIDHVTGMLGLNAREKEVADGVMRLNWNKRREAEYLESSCIHVAGCLAIGNPAILSCF